MRFVVDRNVVVRRMTVFQFIVQVSTGSCLWTAWRETVLTQDFRWREENIVILQPIAIAV